MLLFKKKFQNILLKTSKMDGFDLRFSIPSNMLIVGPTSSGKTTWLKHLVVGRHEYFATPPENHVVVLQRTAKSL